MLSAHALWINPSSLLYCTFKNFLCYFKEMYTVGIRVSFLKKVICVWKVDYSPVVYIVCTWIKLLTAWNVVRKQWIWIRFVCNPETEEDMYRCYSTSCQLWSFVYVDCLLRIDHADISLNIFQVNKFHLKCKLIFKNAPSLRIPIYRKYRLATYYLILHWKWWFTVASELWIFYFNISSLQFSARD